MSTFELRPHHALCIGFFRGKGYSPAFVENMARLAAALRASDPLLTLRGGGDTLCRSCPHERGGVCDSADKVARYDAAVLRLLGAADGETRRWSAWTARAQERILGAGKLREVCGDCQWYDICSAQTGSGA